jgi:hypothetical protein
MIQEIFKDIDESNGLYQVSNLGNMRSYNNKDKEVKILTPNTAKGYAMVHLRGDVNKSINVHRLVAKAFIPNPENKKEVNHINGDKSDNRVENLEWSTRSENIIHAYKTGLKKGYCVKGKDNPFSIPVVQMTLGNVIVGDYASAGEAARQIGGCSAGVNNCCNGKRNTYYGFKWEFSI